jgi:tetratricopeptide (TPR) repeat protein
MRKECPKDPDVQLEIGRANLALGEPKAAVKALEGALALQAGERPDVLLLLAEAEIAAEKVDGARKRLETEVQAHPESWLARLMLARIALLQGEWKAAHEQADIVLQQRPTYVAAFLVKSEALSGEGKPEEGKDVLQTVYDRITKDVPEVNVALADLTARFETEAAYKQAALLYGEVLEKDAENWRALYGLAWVLEREGKFPEAEEKYRQVQTLQPLSAIVVNSVGYCLLKQGRVSQAQVQFKRALDMDPDYVTALANLGATYDAQAKYSEAIRIYEKILKMKGQKDNLRALINCAFDHEAGGAFPKATKLLLQAHDVVPNDANVCVWLGDNHYFQKKWKEAESWYQKAIGLDEKSYFGWRGLGLTLAQKRRWADCANALEKASALKPDEVDLYVTLGDIYYEELKDLETALKRYEEYVQRGGTDPQVQEAITEIKKELERK